MDYKKLLIEEIEKERAAFDKLYLSFHTWFETSIERTYWTDEDKAAFDPMRNGLFEARRRYYDSFDRRVAAIKAEKPATYISLAGQ